MLFCFGRGSSRRQDSCWSNVVCLCATISQVLIMGIGQGFGVFLPVIMNQFSTSREYAAWIGSIAIAMTFCLSPVTGRLCDRFGSRPVAIVGALCCSLGLILTSLVKTVELFYLTYSVLFGFGACCCRTANFLITAKYFIKRRSFATGLVTAGAGLGVFALAPINQTLIDDYGLSITYRVLGFVILVNCFLALSYDPNIEEEEEHQAPGNSQETLENSTPEVRQGYQKLIDFSVWKVPSFAVVAVCCAGVSIVIFTPQFHLVRHCEDLGIPADKSSKLLMFYGLSSCAFRIATGRLCDMKRITPIYVFQFGMLVSGVSVIMFGVPSSYVPLAVISAFFGMGDGTSLTAGNLLLLTTVEPKKRASAFGLANMLISVSVATGAPLSGFIADQARSYVLAFYVAGSMGVVFSCLPFVLLRLKRETQLEEVNSIAENEEGMHGGDAN